MSDFELIMYFMGFGFTLLVLSALVLTLLAMIIDFIFRVVINSELKEYLEYKKNNKKDKNKDE